MNIPHTHPRATEINVAINGTLRTGMLAENGARFVFNNVPAGSATVFPQGAIHFEMNTECREFSCQAAKTWGCTLTFISLDPTLFVAAFNHEDPGTLAIAQRCTSVDPCQFNLCDSDHFSFQSSVSRPTL